MSPRFLLILSAVFEALVGAIVLVVPDAAIALLLGGTAGASATVMARLFGAGVLSLGLVGLAARDDLEGPAGLAVTYGFTCYNVVAALLLVWTALTPGYGGVLLWPAAIAHVALGILFVLVLVRAGREPGAGQRHGSG